jgi:ribonuclease R
MKTQRQNHTIESLREQILIILTDKAPEQLKTNELSKELGIRATDPEYELVREALEALLEEGAIFKGTRRKFGVKVPEVMVEGRLENVKQGLWMVVPKGGNRDEALEIDSRDTWTAFHGDIVRAKLISVPRPGERAEGEVVRVIERKTDQIVGTLKRGRYLFLHPDDRRIHRTITIREKRSLGAHIGDKVVVRLDEWNDPELDPEGTVIEKLGRSGEMKAEIMSIARAHDLPYVFPQAVLDESEAFPDSITDEDLQGRRDLRDMDIFTIDPYDARDFDDAISIQQHDNGEVTLGIHIADVSHYVQEGSALDEEAYVRGTSVYLVTGVIPMLPERLSNNLCSLRPNEDRLAFTVFVRLSSRGAIRDYEITKSVIRSKRRFTYEEALQVLETGKGDYAEELLAINKIVHVLRANRRRKGSVDFDTTELKFVLDENEHPVEVIQKSASESTKLIEDCMLLANRVVAEHIGKQRNGVRGGDINPFVYRIHDVPPKDKLVELSRFVKGLGYTLPVDNIQPKDIQKLIDAAKGTEEQELINEVTLRSMAKAIYSDFNIGHFGLAFTHYSHFTSPIRRYPDLIVHRMLFEYGQGMSRQRRDFYADSLGELTYHCSLRERAAVEAERASVKIAGVEFLKQHLGDVFEAVISGVMHFGLFAELKRFGIEGLVRVRSLGDDYYVHDESTKSFRGRHSGTVFRIGDPIFVRIIRVDDQKSEIDMNMISEAEFLAETGESGKVREPGTEKLKGRSDTGRGMGNQSGGRPGRRKQKETAESAAKSQSRSGRGGKSSGSGKTTPARKNSPKKASSSKKRTRR